MCTFWNKGSPGKTKIYCKLHSWHTSIFSGRNTDTKMWRGREWRSKQYYHQKWPAILALVITCSPTQLNLALCKGFATLGFSIYKKSSGREWRVCQYFPLRDSESASWEPSSSPFNTFQLNKLEKQFSNNTSSRKLGKLLGEDRVKSLGYRLSICNVDPSRKYQASCTPKW